MQLESVIKCPECGFEKEETMPSDPGRMFLLILVPTNMIISNSADCVYVINHIL